jgi:DNA mismatch repair protein MutL
MPDHVIHILPEQVASQIAAGEVVERPASAVKELIENSLDAGARCVTVEIAAGGAALIAVSDDGCGMSPHDAVLALRRHATSKIRDASDLVAIRSLGFRGEALASIASVSRLELKTRRAEDLSGVHLSVTGGEMTAREECAMAPGTRIEARDLFFNTPARLKFLKSVNAEQSAAIEVVQRLALGCAGVAFEMRVDGRQVLDLPPAAGLLERFRQLYGAKLASQVLAVSGAGDGARIEGLISLSQESFASARMLYTFVNGRAVRDRLMIRAISNAYATLIPRGRYPAVVLFITLRPHDVDVNVHPMKAEVRFRRGGAVFENIYRVLRDRLSDQTAPNATAVAPAAAAQVDPEPRPAEKPDAPAAVANAVANRATPQPERPAAESALRLVLEADAPPPARAQQQTLGLGYRSAAGQAPGAALSAVGNGDQHAAPVPAYSELRLIGQLFAGYIALESDEGLLLVDQHAAHERVTFERLKAQLGGGGVEVQAQLVPETLEMNPARAAQVHAAIPKLRALGFDIEPFGPTTLLLKGTPAVFGAGGGLRLLSDMIESLGDGSPQWRGEEGFEALLKQLACHGSVRVGRILKDSEIHALLADLDRTAFKTNCPHGRPVHIRFGRNQIERLFRR